MPIRDAISSYYLQSWLALNKQYLLFPILRATCQRHKLRNQCSYALPCMSPRTFYTQGTRSSAPKRIRSLTLGTGGGLPADPHLCLSHDTPDVPAYVEMIRNVQYRKLPIPPPNPGDAEELWESRRRQIRKSKFACTQRQDIPAERSHEVPKETIKGVSSLSPV